MKKPEGWYGIKVTCELLELLQSNMVPSSQHWFCKRKDRQGTDRPRHSMLRCHWNVCPKLKEERRKGHEEKRDIGSS